MEVQEANALRQASTALEYNVKVAKGAQEQQEKVVMTLLESTGASAAQAEGRGSLVNVVA